MKQITYRDPSNHDNPLNNQIVRVVRQLDQSDNVDEEVGPMYLVVFPNNVSLHVFADELVISGRGN